MPKPIIMLAVLLAAAQVPMPVPGQTAESAPQIAGKADSKSQNPNNDAAPPAAIVNQPQTPRAGEGAGNPAAENKEYTVKLTSLPPVAIAEKQKTYWDYLWDSGPWAFVLILAMAGAWQIRLLKKTWKSIKRQADAMEAQTKDARESAVQIFGTMKEQADAATNSAKAATLSAMAAEDCAKVALAQIEMMKAKERAKVRIEVDKLVFVPDPSHAPALWAPAKIFNLGETKAIVSEARAALVLSSSSKSQDAEFEHPLTKAAFIPASDQPIESTISDVGEVKPDVVLLLNTESLFAHVYGRIVYTDVFGEAHGTRFRYVWKTHSWVFAARTAMSDDPDGTKALYGDWEKTKEGNEEY